MKERLVVKNLYKVFGNRPEEAMQLVRDGVDKAEIFARTGQTLGVYDASFTVYEGEIFVVMGLSGSGKSTLVRLLNRLIDPTAGQVLFDAPGGPVDIVKLDGAALKTYRRRMQIIFQDPFASLDPRTPIGSSIAEGLRIHATRENGWGDATVRRDRVLRMMDMVGLASYHARRYPHEFSGGQRQRIGIARALVLEPDLVVCDEPVSALDVSIQAQVLNLLKNLQRELGLTYLFIAHNMGVVEHISDRVAVMYLGRVAELADRRLMFTEPLHPYTQALFSAIPVPDPELRRKRIILEGDVPSPLNPPSGCRFNPRCQLRAQLGGPSLCVEREPALVEVQDGQSVACHFRGPSATANLAAIQSHPSPAEPAPSSAST